MNISESREYTQTTDDLTVRVVPEYLPEQSNFDRRIYSFAYTITIENRSPDTVQLLSRHWIVTSAGEKCAEVKGEGVVGEQPVLQPGASFTYTSGTVIHDPVGAMEGNYTFRRGEGSLFKVAIPRFGLVCPAVVH